MGACGSLGAECRVARHVMGRPGAQTEVAPATGLVQQGALRTSAGASERTTAVGCFDILPALKKGRGFLRSLVWFQPELCVALPTVLNDWGEQSSLTSHGSAHPAMRFIPPSDANKFQQGPRDSMKALLHDELHRRAMSRAAASCPDPQCERPGGCQRVGTYRHGGCSLSGHRGRVETGARISRQPANAETHRSVEAVDRRHGHRVGSVAASRDRS